MRSSRIPSLIFAALVLAGCGGSGSAAAGPPLPGHVSVANFAFAPDPITVGVGGTVTWDFHQPDAPHNVVSGAGPDQFNSGAPQGGGHFAHQFTQAGTYSYVCTVHPSMRGTVTVTP